MKMIKTPFGQPRMPEGSKRRCRAPLDYWLEERDDWLEERDDWQREPADMGRGNQYSTQFDLLRINWGWVIPGPVIL